MDDLHPYYIVRLRQRLEQYSRFDETGCRIWTRSVTSTGYGQVMVKNGKTQRPEKAHRAAWRVYKGPIPEGMCVLHKCDNTLCIHEDHLFLGTKADNSEDMVAKGRSSHGSRNGRAVLDEADVRDILRLLRFGTKQQEIADAYGVTRSLVSMIKHGRAWPQLNTGDIHKN
jgi:hypothetical protein